MQKDQRFQSEINFRELGGYPTIDGRNVRNGFFYRSGGPYRMKRSELGILENEIHLKAILDLRTKEEVEKSPDPSFPNIRMIQHSGLVSKGGEDIDFSPVGMSKIGEEGYEQIALLTEYYKQMPFGNQAFQVMFDEILQGNVPILIHCATGKDRTGVAAILLLLALGCSEETALQDYLLSNAYRSERITKMLKKKEELFQTHPEVKELILMKEGVTERIGKIVIQEIKNRYDSYDVFFEQEYHLSQDQIQYLRDTYTE